MLNGSVQFNGDDWTLRFSQDKAFYQIPAQSKIAELEAAAKNLSGRKVKISLAVEEASSAAPAAKKEPKKKTKSTPVAAKQVEILDEEPLTSTSLQTAVVSSAQKGALEEVKEILDVIPGELLA